MIVNNYNNGLFKVLLISSAGSESLDLKNTRQVHIMEPHWNESKIIQVIGRSIRYGSHISLPQNERKVDIYRWISIFPNQYRNISADEYLTTLSQRKMELWNKYNQIVIDASIENNYFAK
ncbi:helicase conserved C-terminal domain (PFAM) [Acanthamoeba polyphaga mimivirus]|uniref:Helicase conserved C-terminal domain (PFAM) n=5 Tax=Mimivirus TaxID=315393 RepID=F8V680_MIMIV|nr:helicase conserved C-terminal domain (PFAM) [Acanthamoeba polyphaga mimivirus]